MTRTVEEACPGDETSLVPWARRVVRAQVEINASAERVSTAAAQSFPAA